MQRSTIGHLYRIVSLIFAAKITLIETWSYKPLCSKRVYYSLLPTLPTANTLQINALRAKSSFTVSQFRSFVEGANDIIYTIDLHGHFTYISPNYQTIFGADPATLLNKPFSEVLHPRDLPSALESFASSLQGNRVTEIEYRVHHSDRRWLCQSSNIGPIVHEENRPSTIIGVGRDIHQHKRYENELKQATEAAEELNRALAAANAKLNH